MFRKALMYFRVILVVILVILLINVLEERAWSAAPKEVPIGVVFPLSGSGSTMGVRTRQAIEFAAEIINEKSDLPLPFAKTRGIPSLNGAPIKFIFADHQGSPEKGASETERLITYDNVVSVIGCYQTAVTATASLAAERYQTPFVNSGSVGNILTERNLKWFFRLSPNVTMIVNNFMTFLEEFEKSTGNKINTVAVVYENTLWGQECGPLFVSSAKKQGYNVVAEIRYPYQSTDVSSEVQKVKSVNPDIVIEGSAIGDAMLFMKKYKEMRVRPKAILGENYGFNDPMFIKNMGKDAEGIIIRETWSPDIGDTKKIAAIVNEEFKKRSGVDLNGDMAREFTGIFVLAEALNKTGSLDKNALRKALQEINIPGDQTIMSWDGIRFDSKGQNIHATAIIVQIQNGKYVTIWPRKYQKEKVIWPLLPWD